MTWTEGGYDLAFSVGNAECDAAWYTMAGNAWSAYNGNVPATISITISLPGYIFDLSSIDLIDQANPSGSSVGSNTVQIASSNGGTPKTGLVTATSSNNSPVTFNGFASNFSSITSFTISYTSDNTNDATSVSLTNLTLKNITVHPGAPVVTTATASSVSATGATLNGTVNDNGGDTTVTFDWGVDTTYGGSVTATPSLVTAGTGTASVSGALSGLTCGMTYHYRVKGINGGGTTNGSDASFTPPCPPSATTAAASSISAAGATLNGTVAANGSTTDIVFDYGLTSSYGAEVTASPGSTSASGSTAVTLSLTGLSCNTTYHFRVAATNPGGTVNGSDLMFTTSACAPSVTTGSASAISGSGATLAGSVSTNGDSATVIFEYGTTTSYGSSAAASPSPVSGTNTSVEASLSNLTCGTTYHYRVKAVNSSDTSVSAVGSDGNFATTTSPPGAPTIGTATAGDGQASVTFSAPGSTGCSAITGYTMTSSPGGKTGTSATSPIVVTGLTNGTSYTFTVTATNAAGTSAASADSNAVTPLATQTITFANPGAQSFGTSPTLSASATSGLTVTFSSTTTAVCTISGNVLTFVAVGSCSIDADQSGDSSHAAAPTVSRNFAVNAVAPGAPTSVSATAGNQQATVSFSAPAFTGGSPMTGYTVTSSPGPITATGTTTSITVGGLTNGTEYTFTVTAANSAGTGPASAASSGVTPKGTQTITFADPGTQSFGTSPTLSATATSALAVSFSSSTTGVCTVTTGGTLTFVTAGSCTIIAGQPGNTAWVAATPVSQTFTVTPVAPGAPTSVSATAGNGQAIVSFTAPASSGGVSITGYTVTSNPGGITANGATGPITVAGLSNGTSYTFTVTATNSAGTGPASAASSSVTPAAVPDAPTIGTATASDGNAIVTFTAPANDGGAAITGYTVTSNPANITVTGTASPIQVTGLTNGISYTFTVTASNSVGTSAASAESNVVTPMGSPPGPGWQAITFANPGPQNFGTSPTMSATSTSGLPVTFSSSTPEVCTTSSEGVLKLIRAGTCTINAGQSGDGAHLAAETVTRSFAVVPVVPGAPTLSLASAQDGQATVTFVPPVFDGGADITGYVVTVGPAATTVAGSASPVLVTGLRNGAAYTFTVAATNSVGPGPASSASDYVVPGPKGQLLVVSDSAESDALARLTERATTGHNLTVKTAIGVPSSLDGYDQVWDLRYGEQTALTEAERAVYLAYLQQGGALLLVGEAPASALRNASLATLVSDVGGGTLALDSATATQTVHAPFSGPIALSSVTYAGVCGATGLGRGVSISSADEASAAVAWLPGTLGQAPAGGLLAIFDIDFMKSADGAARALLENLINYEVRTSRAWPGISDVTGPSAGSYKAGSVLEFTLAYGAPVVVTGIPKLPLTIEGVATTASYSGGTGTSKLTFKYTVKNGDNGSLAYGTALDLTGATLTDGDGFPARVGLSHASMGTVALDTTPPAVPAIAGITGTSVTGTAEPSTTVTVYVGGTSVATATADADGRWTCTLPTNQAGPLTVFAADAAGNASDASKSVDVDTSIPIANAVAVTVPYESATAIALNITKATPSSVAVVEAAKHGTAAASGTSISYTPAPGYSGLDSFSYTASNVNGTSPPAMVSITVTRPAGAGPTLVLSTLSDGAVTSDRFINVSGVIITSGQIQSLTLNGVALPIPIDGSFSYPVHLGTGTNTIRVVATDDRGLSGDDTRTVVLDPSAPAMEFSQPSDGAVVPTAAVTVSGSVASLPASTDAVSSVAYTVNGGSPQAASSSSAFSFVASLVPGLNTVEVVATMASGKVVHGKRTLRYLPSMSLRIVDPANDVFVTSGQYALGGDVAFDGATVAVAVSFAGQTYTPTVSNGVFTQSLILGADQAWPVQITATASDGRTATVWRNLVKVAATDSTVFTMADAYRALQIASGLITAIALDLARYDVAPMVQGKPTADGVIDIADASTIMWLASGQAL